MRERLKVVRNKALRFRRLPILLIAIAATAVGSIAAVTVISRRQAEVKESRAVQQSQPATATAVAVKPSTANAANKTYVTVKVAGQDVQIDGQTGQMKPLSPEEAQKLAAGLRQEINQSTEGLQEVQHPDGSVSVDLQGRFQDVAVARKNDDGTVATSCVDNPRSAGAFFGIDPQLIDSRVKPSTGTRRAPQAPAQNQNQ